MALTLQLQKPSHSLEGGDAVRGRAVRILCGHPWDQKHECPELCWPWLAGGAIGSSVLSPVRSHPFFLTRFFQETFLDQQCFYFHESPFELSSPRILFIAMGHPLFFLCFTVQGTKPSAFVACHFPAQC